MRPELRKYLPHIWIILGFAAVSLIYCLPALRGMELTQHDNVSWKGMARESQAYHDSTGVNSLWTNSMFGGMPTYTINIPKSNNYIVYIQVAITSILAKPAYFLFIAMLGFYILMSVLRMNRWLAAIGAVAYAFSTYNITLINAGHETKLFAIGYLPAVLAGIMLIFRGRWLAGACLYGISFALLISTNHYQMAYYTGILLLFYYIGQLIITIREKGNMKNFIISSAIAAVMSLVAVGPGLQFLLTTKEYTQLTMRGGTSELTLNHDKDKKTGGLDKDYAFNWSLGIGETFDILIPYLHGGSSSESISKAPETEALIGSQYEKFPIYWGPQDMGISGPIYFGAVICFLFVLGLMVVRSPHKWWIVVVCAVTIMMAWGKHFAAFNYFLFDHLPMYNKFRTPTMIMTIPQLLFPVLGIWGLMEILTGNIAKEEVWKKIKLAAIITAGICVLFALGGGMFLDYTNPAFDAQMPEQIMKALKADRAALATKSAFMSAIYILIAAGLLWAFVKDKINKTVLMGGLALIIAIDLISVATDYLNESNYQDASDYSQIFAPRPVDAEILKDKDPYYRVLDLSRNTYNDAVQSYLHKAIGGYSPAKMESYQDLIDYQLGGAQAGGKFNAQVLDMLNAKYIIFEGPQKQPVYQLNPGANGNAWFVDEVKMVKSADEEMLSLKAPALGDTAQVAGGFDSKKTAIVRETFARELQGLLPGKDSAASIKLTKYGLNDLSYVSSNSREGLAVFSDIYYPYGWKAFVDGKEVPIIKANYVLRAIRVPAGNHNIQFRFHPDSFYTGDTVALICSLLLIGLLVVVLIRGLKGSGGPETVNE